MLGGDVGDAVEVVDDAGVGRPGRGDHADDVAAAAGRRAARPRSACPVRRWSTVGTVSTPTPSTCSALPTDEWASSLIATSGRSGAVGLAPVGGGVAGHHEGRQVAGRAAGHEAAARRRRGSRPALRAPPSAWFSATTTPAASSQEVPWRDEHDTNMSKSSDAFVGAAGMNERKRGLSHETTAVESLSTKSFSTCAASLPSARMRPASSASSDATRPPKSSGTGSMRRRSRQAARMRSVMPRRNSNIALAIRPASPSGTAWTAGCAGAPGLLGPAGHLVQRCAGLPRPRRRRRTPAWPGPRSPSSGPSCRRR